MIKKTYILLILTNLLVLNTYAQIVIDSTNIDSLLLAKKEVYYPNTFSLEDSVFEVGSVLMNNIHFNFGEVKIHESSYSFLDNVVLFLIKNKGLELEIINNKDTRIKPEYSIRMSPSKAYNIKKYLILKGVEENRLICKGSSGWHIISKEVILALPTKELQEKAHALNRRTEFKIIKTN